MTNAIASISLETPCSISLGSDLYEAEIVKITKKTVTARRKADRDELLVFRAFEWTYGDGTRGVTWSPSWRSPYRLVIGECETRLDPSF